MMDGPTDAASIIWYLAVLVLVGSSLLYRRIAWRSAIGMAAAWVAVFAIILTIVSYRNGIASIAYRVSGDILGRPRQNADGNALRVALAEDGHYWVDGTVDGAPTRFLIDSGATFTALSGAAATASGLQMDTRRIPVTIETANGQVQAARSMVSSMQVGPITMNDLPVVVSPAFGKTNVLGMNFLSRLKSWRVEEGEMVLEP